MRTESRHGFEIRWTKRGMATAAPTDVRSVDMDQQKSARGIHRLSVTEIRQAKADVNDGGGLVLRINREGGAAWVLRFTSPSGQRREMGLGVCARQSAKLAGDSVADVRKLAAELRAMLDRGVDPLAARQAQRTELAARTAREKAMDATRRDVEHWTLARCARDYHERVIEPKLSPKHAAQWIASLGEPHAGGSVARTHRHNHRTPARGRAVEDQTPQGEPASSGRATAWVRHGAASSSGWRPFLMTRSFTNVRQATRPAVPHGARLSRLHRCANGGRTRPCPLLKHRQ